MISSKNKHNGFAIALAWPETQCKEAGAWYDGLMRMININKNGYYKVGHAAIVLVEDISRRCHYFDFGRYHAPHGHGRVRSATTDHDLKIFTKAVIDEGKFSIANLNDILLELANNSSTHGTGTIYGSLYRIDFDKGSELVRNMQEQDFLPYGPFIRNGTNCSRFVNSVLQESDISLIQSIVLKLPWMLTPTPLYNLKAGHGPMTLIEDTVKNEQQSYIFQTS